MVSLREEVRREEVRGISEKEDTGEFWAGQGLVHTVARHGGPQLPRPPPRLRLAHADIPACPILGGHPNGVVRSGWSGGCPGPSPPQRRTARMDTMRPCPGSEGPSTLPPPPPHPYHIGETHSLARHRAGAPPAFLPLLVDDEGQRAAIVALAARATGIACSIKF